MQMQQLYTFARSSTPKEGNASREKETHPKTGEYNPKLGDNCILRSVNCKYQSLPPKMGTQALDGAVQGSVVLAEAEACEVPRCGLGLIESADRDRGHPSLYGDVAAEILVRAVKA
jgi:hypothetical protein